MSGFNGKQFYNYSFQSDPTLSTNSRNFEFQFARPELLDRVIKKVQNNETAPKKGTKDAPPPIGCRVRNAGADTGMRPYMGQDRDDVQTFMSDMQHSDECCDIACEEDEAAAQGQYEEHQEHRHQPYQHHHHHHQHQQHQQHPQQQSCHVRKMSEAEVEAMIFEARLQEQRARLQGDLNELAQAPPAHLHSHAHATAQQTAHRSGCPATATTRTMQTGDLPLVDFSRRLQELRSLHQMQDMQEESIMNNIETHLMTKEQHYDEAIEEELRELGRYDSNEYEEYTLKEGDNDSHYNEIPMRKAKDNGQFVQQPLPAYEDTRVPAAKWVKVKDQAKPDKRTEAAVVCEAGVFDASNNSKGTFVIECQGTHQKQQQQYIPPQQQQQQQEQQQQSFYVDSDLEFEMAGRDQYKKYYYPRPNLDEITETSVSGGQAEFIQVEPKIPALNLNFLMNAAPMRYTDRTEDTSDDEVESPKDDSARSAKDDSAKSPKRKGKKSARSPSPSPRTDDEKSEDDSPKKKSKKSARGKSPKRSKSPKGKDKKEKKEKKEKQEKKEKMEKEKAEKKEKKEKKERKEREKKEKKERREKEKAEAEALETERDEETDFEEKAEKKEKKQKKPKKEKVDKADYAEKSDRSDRSDKPDKFDRSEKPEKHEKPDKPDKHDKREKRDKSEKSEDNDKPEKPEKPEKQEKPEKSEKTEKAEKTEKVTKSPRKKKPRAVDRTDTTERLEIACHNMEKLQRELEEICGNEQRAKARLLMLCKEHEILSQSVGLDGVSKSARAERGSKTARGKSPPKAKSARSSAKSVSPNRGQRFDTVFNNDAARSARLNVLAAPTNATRSARKNQRTPRVDMTTSRNHFPSVKPGKSLEELKAEKIRVFAKMTSTQEAIIEALDRLKMSIVELRCTDLTHRSRHYKAALDFAVTFQRNYILPLKTMINEAISTAPGYYTSTKSNHACIHMSGIFKLILQALQAYHKQLRYFLIDKVPQKLTLLLECIYNTTAICLTKDIFDKSDVTLECIQDRCTKFLGFIMDMDEERAETARSAAMKSLNDRRYKRYNLKMCMNDFNMYEPKLIPKSMPATARSRVSRRSVNAARTHREMKGAAGDSLEVVSPIPANPISDSAAAEARKLIDPRLLGPKEFADSNEMIQMRANDEQITTQVAGVCASDSSINAAQALVNSLLAAKTEKKTERAGGEIGINDADNFNAALVEALQTVTKENVRQVLEPILQMLQTALNAKNAEITDKSSFVSVNVDSDENSKQLDGKKEIEQSSENNRVNGNKVTRKSSNELIRKACKSFKNAKSTEALAKSETRNAQKMLEETSDGSSGSSRSSNSTSVATTTTCNNNANDDDIQANKNIAKRIAGGDDSGNVVGHEHDNTSSASTQQSEESSGDNSDQKRISEKAANDVLAALAKLLKSSGFTACTTQVAEKPKTDATKKEPEKTKTEPKKKTSKTAIAPAKVPATTKRIKAAKETKAKKKQTKAALNGILEIQKQKEVEKQSSVDATPRSIRQQKKLNKAAKKKEMEQALKAGKNQKQQTKQTASAPLVEEPTTNGFPKIVKRSQLLTTLRKNIRAHADVRGSTRGSSRTMPSTVRTLPTIESCTELSSFITNQLSSIPPIATPSLLTTTTTTSSSSSSPRFGHMHVLSQQQFPSDFSQMNNTSEMPSTARSLKVKSASAAVLSQSSQGCRTARGATAAAAVGTLKSTRGIIDPKLFKKQRDSLKITPPCPAVSPQGSATTLRSVLQQRNAQDESDSEEDSSSEEELDCPEAVRMQSEPEVVSKASTSFIPAKSLSIGHTGYVENPVPKLRGRCISEVFSEMQRHEQQKKTGIKMDAQLPANECKENIPQMDNPVQEYKQQKRATVNIKEKLRRNSDLKIDSLLRERDQFRACCQKSRFYSNPLYAEPWKIFSSIANKIVMDVVDTVEGDFTLSVQQFVEDFVEMETRI